MPRRPKLTAATLDMWRLVASALDVGAMASARGLADEAMRLSGWDRYIDGCCFRDDEIFYSAHMPRGWAYHARDGRDNRLLVHGDAVPLVGDLLLLRRLMTIADELGSGLLRLDEILAAALIGLLTAPSDASGLIQDSRRLR